AILVLLMAALGAGCFLAALDIKFRDFRYTITFILQFLFFATQVIFPLQLIQNTWARHILSLNPVNAAIELFRSPLYGMPPDMNIVMIGIAASLVMAIAGVLYFRKTEAYF